MTQKYSGRNLCGISERAHGDYNHVRSSCIVCRKYFCELLSSLSTVLPVPAVAPLRPILVPGTCKKEALHRSVIETRKCSDSTSYSGFACLFQLCTFNMKGTARGRISVGRRQCVSKSIQQKDQPHRSFASVSSSEVSKFSSMSDNWWNPRQNPLVGMNPVRVAYILDSLGCQKQQLPPLTGLKVLDVGCGGGLLSESLARLGASVTAIDPATALVNMAQAHAQRDPKTASIDYRAGTSIEEVKSSESDFDLICILEVLEHATDVDSILQAASTLLNPNGTLFVSTMNRTLKSHLLAIVGAEYIMGYLPPGTHNWNQFLSPEEVDNKMKQVGLKEIHSKGMILTSPPINGNWRWKISDSDKEVNWIGAYKHAT